MTLGVKELIILGEAVKTDDITWVVAAALINPNDQVLVQKRALGRTMAGLWEFPGGKIELNERPEDALVRELYEELGITVASDDLTPLSFASAPLNGGRLLLLLYVCQKWLGEAVALDAEVVQWLAIDKLQNLDMPAADVPLVKALQAHLWTVPSQS
jgi:8-oxo-dGTP diphosphatase